MLPSLMIATATPAATAGIHMPKVIKVPQGQQWQQIGTMRESHFGQWKPWQPVFAGPVVGPAEGWASIDDARRAIAALKREGSGSALALMRSLDAKQNPVFRAHVLLDKPGHDVKPWHIPVEFNPGSFSWTTTLVGGPLVAWA